MSFGKDIARFGVKVTKGSNNLVRRVGMAAYQKITNLTPVDTGRAKGNWFPALNYTSEEVTEDEGFDGGRGAAEFGGAKIGDELNISNSLPYIKKLETGSSDQAPQGMMRIATLQLKKEIETGKYND